MSKLETPMILHYWQLVGGTLVPEFQAVARAPGIGRRLIDALILPRGALTRAHWRDVSLDGEDVIAVQAKAYRLGMYSDGPGDFFRRVATHPLPTAFDSLRHPLRCRRFRAASLTCPLPGSRRRGGPGNPDPSFRGGRLTSSGEASCASVSRGAPSARTIDGARRHRRGPRHHLGPNAGREVAHVSALTRVPLEAMPDLKVRQREVDGQPVGEVANLLGIHPEGRWVFVCLISDGTGGNFRGCPSAMLNCCPDFRPGPQSHPDGAPRRARARVPSVEPARVTDAGARPQRTALVLRAVTVRQERRPFSRRRPFKTSVRAFSGRRIPAMYHA